MGTEIIDLNYDGNSKPRRINKKKVKKDELDRYEKNINKDERESIGKLENKLSIINRLVDIILMIALIISLVCLMLTTIGVLNIDVYFKVLFSCFSLTILCLIFSALTILGK